MRRALSVLLLALVVLGAVPPAALWASDTPDPETVTIPGTIQSALGCPADWQPACDKTFLTLKQGIWQGEFALPAGDYEYKVALNQSWDENYGANAQRGGANIKLSLTAPQTVTFLYDHATHLVIDSVNSPIPAVIGTFQDELGCASDNEPTCLAGWLGDANGDGLYTFVTTNIPAGTYEVRVALNQSADQVLGADGTPDGEPATFTVQNDGDEIYFAFNPDAPALTINTEGAPKGNIRAQQAHWVTTDALIWNVIGSPKYSYELHFSPEGTLELGPRGISGGQMLPLTFDRGGAGDAVFDAFPHLIGSSTLRLDPADVSKVPDILRGQVAVLARDADGNVVDASGVQIPGVLDAVYQYDGPLGVTFDGAVPTLRVWAPTAQQVDLLRYSDALSTTDPISSAMSFDPATGVWSSSGDADWRGQYYLYDVTVYVPSTGKIEHNLVTDPYSFSLSQNSTRSQIVDLNDPALKPAGWDAVQKPALESFSDIVLYELHIRDFSIADASVPEELRGTYKAFTVADSSGMQHLRGLAAAGLTHIHLLPTFDIATIEEDRAAQERVPTDVLRALPADADQQQGLLAPLRDKDGFNWGYDPYHYTVPEGSYSTNPSDTTRIVEFREMVQALNQADLRVVMDVVYNHTNSSGQSERSVLDKIVPGYYHRLNGKGEVENSTCCSNTATEHRMMEKLMIDSVLTWAKQYKVDGFRFDLMGHHMRANMVDLRQALDSLTLEQDGVDGSKIYVYGEGWNFGEVADNARGINATQLNMGGTGIGTFNDRLRDAVRGGGPFSGYQEQGFATGLLDTPNASDQGAPEDQREKLLLYSDQIRVGLAGNLKSYTLTNYLGEQVSGAQVPYNGQPTGYTEQPYEQIVYVSAHDNETLFDAVQVKAPDSASLADRVRMHNLAMNIVALAQGVPFFHAGDDLLRSKSLDRNSYNSGDWFNAIDWTGQTTNWGIGLPPAGDNQDKWPIIQPLLANPALKPTPADTAAAAANFTEMLRIRRSSPLFRLRSAADIEQRLSFANTGPDQQPGLIVMQLTDYEPDLDPTYDRIVVLFNATSQQLSYTLPDAGDAAFALHPIQADSADPVVREASYSAGTFSVPAYTTAVFVQPEQGALSAAAATAAPATAEPATAAPATTAPQPTAAPTVAAPTATAPAANERTVSTTGVWIGLGIVALASVLAAFVLRKPRR